MDKQKITADLTQSGFIDLLQRLIDVIETGAVQFVAVAREEMVQMLYDIRV